MLAADRALTLDEVLATVAPMAGYIESRRWPVAGAANLTDRATIRRTLAGAGRLRRADELRRRHRHGVE